MKKINLGITGCMGRMGQQLIKSSKKDINFKIVTLTENRIVKNKFYGIKPELNSDKAFKKAEVIIDFTIPKCTLEVLKIARRLKKKVVIGTTGFNKNQENLIKKYSKKIPILKAGNMSLGINLINKLIKISSSSLKNDFDIIINETHHRHKIDAPSGTAVMMGQAAAEGKNKKFENIKKISRLNIKAKSTKDKIVVSSFRKGEVIGDHEIIFSSRDEDITIKHTAKDRGIFANGAIQAVKWGMNKKPGLFDMSDVLNIS